jgi:hypothetical protein
MNTGLLWVSYGKDLPWFEISARSYRKFASGFTNAKCVVPRQDEEAFKRPCGENGILLCSYDEWPESKFNHHQAFKCMADLHFPKAEFIFHLDSDTVFAKPSQPTDWIIDGKALLPFRDFETLLTKPIYPGEEIDFQGFHGLKVDFNRGAYFWKFAADFALGWSVIRETMQALPIVHVRGVYETTRKAVAAQHDTNFEGYVRNCRSEHPAGFCEFNTLGAVAHRFYNDRYVWHDVAAHGYPRLGQVVQSWSHGGFDKPHDYGLGFGIETPRQFFTRLGLL